MILTTAAAGDTVRALSSVFIIAQSDNKNREYLVSWLQKISLKQLFFEQGIFTEPTVFKDIYFLERTTFLVL